MRRHQRFSFTLFTLGAMVASTALAQTRPSNNNGYAPPANNGTATQPAAPLMNTYQPSYYPELYDYGTGFPVVEVRAVPPAMVQAAVARAEHRRAHSALGLMILEMKSAFERSRDYLNAINEEREAYEQLQAARREALRSVREDPTYLASVSLRQDLSDQIEHRRRDRFTVPEEILAMAQVKMGYSSTASSMEAAALAADPDVQAARERLRRAAARLTELRLEFDTSVRASPDVREARQYLQDARIGKLASEVYLTGVVQARNIALDYAYHTRRFDRYKYLNYGYHGTYARAYAYPGYRIGYPIGHWP